MKDELVQNWSFKFQGFFFLLITNTNAQGFQLQYGTNNISHRNVGRNRYKVI